MNTTKHTPGPWRYEEETKTIRTVPSNYWIATMDSFEGANNHLANARLIAAAPELLSACKIILNGGIDTGHTWLECCDLVKNAIAEAEGN